MAFEPNYEKLVTSYRKTLTTAQAQVDVKLSTVDASEIKTILCSSAKSHITKAEVNGNVVNYNGLVNFQVIYESVTGEIYGLDYTAEFMDKYTDESGANIFMPIVMSEVVDVDVNVVNSTTISATAIVENRIDAIINENVSVLTSVAGENVFTNMETNTYYNFLGVLNEKYDLTNDIEINDGVGKVLSITPSISLESVTPFTDYVKVVGNVFVDICYLTQEEQPKPRSYTTTLDFNMEVALNGIVDTTKVQSDLFINTSDIKVTSTLDLNKAIINLVLPITYNGYAFNSVVVDNVADLYSTTNELNITTNSVNSLTPSATLTAMEKIDGSVMVNDSFVDEILGNCCNYVTVTSSFVDDDCVVVEGVANTTVIYYSKEDDVKNSIIVEMPFSVRVKGENLDENFMTTVNAVVSDMSTKSKRGQEIEVFAKLYLYVDVYGTSTNAVISEVSVGEEIAPNNCALKIYIVKDNETLWDVAKELGTSVDEIMAQNPDLELPLKAGDRVYIYYQKVMEF